MTFMFVFLHFSNCLAQCAVRSSSHSVPGCRYCSGDWLRYDELNGVNRSHRYIMNHQLSILISTSMYWCITTLHHDHYINWWRWKRYNHWLWFPLITPIEPLLPPLAITNFQGPISSISRCWTLPCSLRSMWSQLGFWPCRCCLVDDVAGPLQKPFLGYPLIQELSPNIIIEKPCHGTMPGQG